LVGVRVLIVTDGGQGAPKTEVPLICGGSKVEGERKKREAGVAAVFQLFFLAMRPGAGKDS